MERTEQDFGVRNGAVEAVGELYHTEDTPERRVVTD